MPELIALLSSDHEEILGILERLEKGVHDSSNPRLTENTLAQQLVMRESAHEATEEMHLWPLVRAQVHDGDALADHGIEQETAGKEALQAFSRMTPEDPPFDETLTRVASAIREHVAFEQERVWPVLRDAVSDDERHRVGDQAASDERSAPTRPHPGTPPSPGTLGTVGRVAALMDRAGDLITGRGRANPEVTEDASAVSRSTSDESWERKKDRR